jgi:hypothetical protein
LPDLGAAVSAHFTVPGTIRLREAASSAAIGAARLVSTPIRTAARRRHEAERNQPWRFAAPGWRE